MYLEKDREGKRMRETDVEIERFWEMLEKREEEGERERLGVF